MLNLSNQLVSVVVLTFNSSKTVIETLESIRAQKDCRIELIVSDDCSTDGTQDIVRQWIGRHSGEFFACHTLFSPENLGICQNVKRAYGRVSGEWFKPIAGDDILLPSALSTLCGIAAQAGRDVGVIVARMHNFSAAPDGGHAYGDVQPSADVLDAINLKPEVLVDRLARSNTIPAPAVLVRRSAFESCGGVDESFTHLDDWPLWMNMLERGWRFQAVPDIVVAYRVHTASVSAKRSAAVIDKRYLGDLISFYERYQKKHFSYVERIDKSIYVLRWRLAMKVFRNKPSAYAATTVLHVLSPLRWKAILGQGRASASLKKC